MDSIERVTRVLRGELPDRVPVGLHCYLLACQMLGGRFDEILRGGEATLGDGLNVSSKRVGAIAGWTLLSMTVGLFFAAIENIDFVGPILARVLDAACL